MNKYGRRIYLASSWRNTEQQLFVKLLRADGHEVYDFRNPRSYKPTDISIPETGFAWSQIDTNYKNWTAKDFIYHVNSSPIAQRAYKADKDAMDWANTCVLLLPSGRSAHLEAGYMKGERKDTFVLNTKEKEDDIELMYLLTDKIYAADQADSLMHDLHTWPSIMPNGANIIKKVLDWYNTVSPSHCSASADVAVRLFNEVTELAYECGATRENLFKALTYEADKQERSKKRHKEYAIEKEFADVSMCLMIFAHVYNINNPDFHILRKHKDLIERINETKSTLSGAVYRDPNVLEFLDQKHGDAAHVSKFFDEMVNSMKEVAKDFKPIYKEDNKND